MEDTKQTLDCWAVVELMGHQRIAGRVTERNVAGTQMLQVDVPENGEQPAFSRLLGGSAIYAVNPCDELTARAWAKSIAGSASPVTSYEGRQLVERLATARATELARTLPEAQSGDDPKKCFQCDRSVSDEVYNANDGQEDEI